MGHVFRLKAALLTDIGRKRSNNEDFVGSFEPPDKRILWQSGSLYVVADGVGGAAKGEVASKYAVEKLLYEYYRHPQDAPSKRLKRIISQIGQEIYEHGNNIGQRMATTLVAAVVWRDKLIVANVGDSRAYLIRDGEARQITKDHNVVGEMLREGLISEEEALAGGNKNRLTRSLGGEPHPKVDIFELPLRQGDRILLCSDGLSRYARREDIASLAAEGKPEEVVKRLIDFANRSGGADNVSAILVEVGEPVVVPEAAFAAEAEDEETTTAALPPMGAETLSADAPASHSVEAPRRGDDAHAFGASSRVGRLSKAVQSALLVAGLLLVMILGIGLGLVVGKAFISSSPKRRPSVAVQSVRSPAPSPMPTQAAAFATFASPAPTTSVPPTPTEKFANVSKACFGTLPSGGTFYGVMYQFGYGGGRLDFSTSYAYPFVAYIHNLPARSLPLKWASFTTLSVPQGDAPDKKWEEFEEKLSLLQPETGILIPGIDHDDCFAKGGDWLPVEELPAWAKSMPQPTLTPTASGSGG